MAYFLQIKNSHGSVVQEIHLSSLPVKIGRSAHNDIVLTDKRVSALHGELFLKDGKLFYLDRSSANGTFCSGKKISEIEIEGEVALQLGDHYFHFVPEADELLEETRVLSPHRRHGSWRLGLSVAAALVVTGLGFYLAKSAFFGAMNLSKPSSIQKLKKGIFEVVIDKIEDSNVAYKDKSAFELIPFKIRNDKYSSIGTAFSVQPGEFITAAHVLSVDFGKLPLKYYLRDDEGKTYPIKEILRYSTRLDLAVFSLESAPEKPLTLEVASSYQEGETVYTVGNAQGEGISVRSGNIASFTPETESGLWKFIRFSAPASPGNSGGPLLNASGAVTGIITMKNGSENLNYALPVEMLTKLEPQRAHFFSKHSENEANQQLLETDEFHVVLPKSVEALASAYSDASFQKVSERRKRFESKFEANLFPKEKLISQYLRNQDYNAFISELDVGSTGRWSTKEQKMSGLQVSGDRKLYFGMFGASVMHLNLEKKRDQTLADFLSRPQEIMDTVVTAVKWSRTVGSAKAEILSYGEPSEREVWKDSYGRSWLLFTWRTHFDRQAHSLNCLPYPSGVDCLWSYDETSRERLRKYYWKVDASRYLFSYDGRVEDWVSFLTDPALDSYRPEFFKGVTVKTAGKKVEFQAQGGFKTAFYFDKLSENSYMSVGVGLSVHGPLGMEIHRLAFMPDSNKPERKSVSLAFEPLPDHPAEYKASWAQMDPMRAPFNGVVIPQDSNQKSMLVREWKPLARAPSSTGEPTPRSKLIFSCQSSIAENQSQFQRECRGFAAR
ncbi:FHA domain-containing protein, partial [bacterium]|nr:FHA domain-containing protein [bacterium]